MNITSVKSPEKRLEVTELSSLLIRAYGVDNLYPQRLSHIIAASSAASLCVRRAARFIEGKGFADTTLYDYTVNRKGDTMDDVLKSVAKDLAKFDGFALHVNYNALGQIVECSHIAFEHCRLGFDDDSGYTGKIAVHADWSGGSKRRGKALKVTAENIDYIDTFNHLREVVLAQIEASGGIEQYKGQIMYLSSDGRNTYPTPRADSIVTDMSTDEGLGNIRLRNARNNFLPAGMLTKPKSATTEEDDQFAADFAQFQGDTKTGNIIAVTYDEEASEVKPDFVPFKAANFDKEFEQTTQSVSETIYAAFEQEKFYRIRSGSLGFSSDIASDVMDDYSDTLSSEQRMIERAFAYIFKYWHKPVPKNFAIIPLKKEKDATSNNQRSDQ